MGKLPHPAYRRGMRPSASELRASSDRALQRRWAVGLVASLLGVAVSIHLTLLHFRVHSRPDVESFCAISESINCDTVALSPYSVFLGVPVAAWGVLGYALMASVAVWGLGSRHREPPVAVGAVIATCAVLASATLGWIAIVHIQSVCILCLTSYVISAAFFFVTTLQVRKIGLADLVTETRHWGERFSQQLALGTSIAVTLLLLFVAAYPKYWEKPTEGIGAGRVSSDASQTPLGRTGGSGVTRDGHPWVGADHPALTIVEYSDYQCPFCAQRHQELRALVDASPGRLRLVHRHFPLDDACNAMVKRSFHPRACQYARLAICATEQSRFWEANDYLYAHGRRGTAVTAQELALVANLDESWLLECVERKSHETLQEDIEAGLRLGITGTPSFTVGSALHVGRIPEAVLLPYVSAPSKPEREG